MNETYTYLALCIGILLGFVVGYIYRGIRDGKD